MEELAKLRLLVESNQVTAADQKLSNFVKQSRNAERQNNKLSKSSKNVNSSFSGIGGTIGSVVPQLAGLTAAAFALNKAFSETAKFQDYIAQLKTATGSTEGASQAFENLEEFARSTPFLLEQSIEAFVKLKNLGLNPSERALTSYGNTASAMGKDLTQLIEAVADATTGEFERLKEFGIKSKSEGDKVSFTFRGMTTQIGKNASEIEEYLTQLGENNFGGAMAERMDTLNGALSNFQDQWDNLFRSVGSGAIGDAMKGTLLIGAEALGAIAVKAKQANSAYTSFIDNTVAYWSLSGDAYKQFKDDQKGIYEDPELKKAEKEQQELLEKRQNGLRALSEIEKRTLERSLTTIEKYNAIGEKITETEKNIREGRFKSLEAESNKLESLTIQYEKLGQTLAGQDKKEQQKLEGESLRELQDRAYLEKFIQEEKIKGLVKERNFKDAILTLESDFYLLKDKIKDKSITRDELDNYKKLEAQIENTKKARDDYHANNKDLKEEYERQKKDELDLIKREANAKEKARKKEFKDLQKSLLTEEEAIQESYNRRLEVILKNTESNSIEQDDLLRRLEHDRDERLKESLDRRNSNYKNKNSELISVASNTFDDLGDSIYRFTQDGEVSFTGMVDSMIDQFSRLAIELAIIDPLKNALSGKPAGIGGGQGGIFGSIFDWGAKLFDSHHSGGIAGQASQSRNVSPIAFAGAPKYHSGGIAGLKPDEVPAVLQRGEEVLTMDNPRHRNNASYGSNVQVNIINEGNSEIETQERQQGGETIIDVIVKKAENFIGERIGNGRGLAPLLQNQYGLSPRIGG